MSGIDTERLVLGALAAGVIIFVVEGAASAVFMDEMAAQLEAHDLAMDMSAKGMVTAVLLSLLVGRAAARGRPG